MADRQFASGFKFVTSGDKQSREDVSRAEYSGADQLDRVLIHLREVRERAAHKGRRGSGQGQRNTAPVEEKLDFDNAPPAEAPVASSESDTASTPAAVSEAPAAASEASDPTRQPAAAATAPPGTAPTASHRAAKTAAPRSTEASQNQPRAPQRSVVTPPSSNPRTTPQPRSPRTQPSPTETASSAPVPSPESPRGLAQRVAKGMNAALGGNDAVQPPPMPKAEPRRSQSAAPSRSGAGPMPATASMTASTHLSSRGELMTAVFASRPAFKAIAWFSLASNVLMLAGPLFMLQVYDRVMTSGSMPTLIALFALTAAIYAFIGLLELVRSRVIVRVGVELDQRMSERVFAASLRRSLGQPSTSLHALREFDQLRQFIAGPGPLTFFDAPWTPIYLLVVFLTHWTLGVAATLGAILLVVIAWASEIRSRQPMAEAAKSGHRSLELAESGQRNAEAITAMGMLSAYRSRWQTANRESLGWQVLASDRLASLSSMSKSLRLLLQSMMLAIGAALAINGQISAGAIIAATIIFGRALAPVEQIVSQWRSFVKARESFAKLEELLKDHPEPPQKTSLPAPKGRLETRGLRVAAPSGQTVILANVTFAVEPGQMVAVIGPSASGKSSLARALVGLWQPAGGEILLDGARLDQWDGEALGRHIGYLPQNVELFAGSVRENIGRFDQSASDADVVAAARAAHAHDMIMSLPKGYDTELGAFGTYLSAGQRQRIGLARALFGEPALIVLDEPNANLDRSGDEALAAAIDGMRAGGHAVVLVSHRVQAIGKADLLLYLERGQQRAFGPREDVLRFLQSGQGGQQGGQASQQAGRNPAQSAASGGEGKR